MRRLSWTLALLLPACADLDRDELGGQSTGLADDGGLADDTGDGDGDDGEIRLDVADGMGTAGDGGEEQGCRGIDFLFVVDNSGSMQDQQQNLAASFPGFVDEIEAKVAELGAADFHVMVVDSDAVRIIQPGPYCSLTCESPQDTCFGEGGKTQVPCALSLEPGCLAGCYEDLDYECDAGTCRDLLGCSDGCGCEMGAGRIDDLEGNPCGVDGGRRYVQKGQHDLHETFACLAEVGISGDGKEHVAEAAVTAVSQERLQPGGCNDGFLRSDSILVVTLITDEEDYGSTGSPPEWYDAIVAAKGGDPEAVVMLGLLGALEGEDVTCDNGDLPYPPGLKQFVESFPRHVVGSVCQPDYSTFFEDAVDLVKETCDGFVPPG